VPPAITPEERTRPAPARPAASPAHAPRRLPSRFGANGQRHEGPRAPGKRRPTLADVAPVGWRVEAAVLLRTHRALVAVLALYAASAVIVPTFTAAPVSDDWVYVRSVEILVRQGELRILDLSVITLVFQVLWGALFSTIFGMSFGALRLSTVVLMFLSGWACYGVCRELGVERGRSALGAAAYLFNPLSYVLGFSFMTDPQFTALLVIATYFHLRGLQPGRVGERATWWGSAVAALAFLTRQQGALIPLAVVVFLVLSGRLRVWPRPRWADVRLFARVVALPAAATVLYYLWLFFVHGVPEQQESFTRSIVDAGWGGTWQLAQRMTFFEAMYVGFFVLPIAMAAVLGVGVTRLARVWSPLGWTMAAGWGAMLAAGLVVFGQDGRRMPYVSQFFGATGLGPNDLNGGGRPWLVDGDALDWLTGVCAAASLVFGLALCRRVGGRRTGDGARAGLLLTIGLWQVIGILPPSFHFRNWIISVDRYLLALLPFSICLALWALRDVELSLPVGWFVVGVMAVVSVAGTRDFLVFQDATWELARSANGQGIENTRLDAGSSWDGYYLYEYSVATNSPYRSPGGPWWTHLFAKATDSTYVVSTAPLWGYDLVSQVEYSTWLDDDPTYLYLVKRHEEPSPLE